MEQRSRFATPARKPTAFHFLCTRRLSLYCCAGVLAACGADAAPRTSSEEPAERTDASSPATRDAGSEGMSPGSAGRDAGRLPPDEPPNEDDVLATPNNAANDPPAGQQGCGGASYKARGKELDVLVLFDNSWSMLLPAISWECATTGAGCPATDTGLIPSLWEVAVAELKSFVRDPRSAGVSLALKYFGTECQADAYATSDVPLGALPEQAAAVESSLDATLPVAETATRPALEGALAFMRARAAEPGYNARPVILLVTDGYPDETDCEDNTTQAVSRVAAEGLAGAPSIASYVFVTAPDLVLDEIAQAGGTERAFLADLSQPGALAEALHQARDEEVAALPCEYELPPEYFSDVADPMLVNLRREGTAIGNVPALADCDEQTGGWYYDDPAAPSRILTCPSTCANLKQGGSIDILLDCPTITLI